MLANRIYSAQYTEYTSRWKHLGEKDYRYMALQLRVDTINWDLLVMDCFD